MDIGQGYKLCVRPKYESKEKYQKRKEENDILVSGFSDQVSEE